MLSQRNSLRLQRGRDRTAQLLEYQDRSRSISAFRAQTFGLQYSLRQGGGRKEGRKADNPFPSVITNAPGLMLSLYQSGKQNGCKKWTENHCCCSPHTPVAFSGDCHSANPLSNVVVTQMDSCNRHVIFTETWTRIGQIYEDYLLKHVNRRMWDLYRQRDVPVNTTTRIWEQHLNHQYSCKQ